MTRMSFCLYVYIRTTVKIDEWKSWYRGNKSKNIALRNIKKLYRRKECKKQANAGILKNTQGTI